MNKTKTRCLSFALALGVMALFASGVAVAQTHTTGLRVTKACPTLPIAQGDTYNCTFSVTNEDPDHGVTLTSVTNTFPWIEPGNPGNGPTVAIPCIQGGSPVTQLGAAGSATQQCGGTVTETALVDCFPTDRQLNDRIAAAGTDQGPFPFTGAPSSGSTTNGPLVLGQACGEIDGRMTGGGSVIKALASRVTHGFELHCDETDLPNNLEINWGRGNNFHLEELTSATCTDDSDIIQQPPGHSPFDTFIGTGIGRCNGVSGALIAFTFVDAGEPGKIDTADIEITACPAGLALSVSGNLKKGNHQAHRNTPQ